MPGNVTAKDASGATFTVGSDRVSLVDFFINKLAWGADGTINHTADTNAARLPVGGASLGNPDDAAAATDVGTFSLVALTKRLLTKIPTLGQNTMANSQPVTIASNQSAVPVSGTFWQATQPVSGTVTANIGTGSLAAGTNAIGDVGLQVRANATGAASMANVISAATNNPTVVKASAGRVLGFCLTNTNAAIRFLKFHNTSAAPTPGSGVVATIPLPPNQSVDITIPQGMGFSTGISYTIVTGAATTDTAAVAANEITGTIVFA